MRHCIVYLLLLTIIIHAVGYADEMPLWYKDSAAVYPPDIYITGLGEAGTKEKAQAFALSEISMYFSSKVDVQSTSSRSFATDLQNERYNETYDDTVNISSQADFFGAKFNTWYDGGRRLWCVLAFLEKNETLKVVKAKLSSEINRLNTVLAKINASGDYLEKLSLYSSGTEIGNTMASYISYIAILSPAELNSYGTVISMLQKLKTDYRSEREKASFSFGDTTATRISNTLKSIMEAGGYNVAPRDGIFIINTTVDMGEEELPAGIFMRSSVNIEINQGEENIFTYAKTLPRYGHKTKSGAVNKNYLEIERDLEANFINEFKEMTGM